MLDLVAALGLGSELLDLATLDRESPRPGTSKAYPRASVPGFCIDLVCPGNVLELGASRSICSRYGDPPVAYVHMSERCVGCS
jgi:hypothetical protein